MALNGASNHSIFKEMQLNSLVSFIGHALKKIYASLEGPETWRVLVGGITPILHFQLKWPFSFQNWIMLDYLLPGLSSIQTSIWRRCGRVRCLRAPADVAQTECCPPFYQANDSSKRHGRWPFWSLVGRSVRRLGYGWPFLLAIGVVVTMVVRLAVC